MILQHVGAAQLVYVSDYTRDYKDVAKMFGMLDENGNPHAYVTIKQEPYMNKIGVSVPSYHLEGKTVNVYVVNDTYKADSSTAEGIAKAMNYFPPDSRYSTCGYDFVSKFRAIPNVIYDSSNRSISLNADNHKDLRGIYDLMMNLGVNNGKLFEPIIARYVYTSREMPRSMPLVGYCNLSEYLRIVRDSRSELFYKGRTKSLVLMTLKPDITPSVKIIGVKNNCAVLDVVGIKEVFDCRKVNSLEPLVIFTKSPLTIRTMKFPWTKVVFDKTNVFMTPIIAKEDAWETLQGGIDLLSVAKR